MATQLGLYNEALTRHLGERRIATLTEERGPRRQLDDIWDHGFIKSVLEAGQWNFAMRTVKVDFSTSIDPEFGYIRAFDHPDDLVRVVAVCQDEYFNRPILRYQDEGAFWFCDYDDIYVRYVSNGASYGGDIANWPESFTRWAAGYMATQAVSLVTKSKTDPEKLEKKVKKLKINAQSIDAMRDPTRFAPEGRWTSSRRGNWRNWDSVHASH